MGIRCLRDTNLIATGIEYRIETFQPSLAVDEIKTLARQCSEIIYNQVHAIAVTADREIERSGPCLRVRGELKSALTK